jgi:hypothetical protein
MQRIQAFWQQQVRAEYASAALTAEFTHWLLQLGAPPELVCQALTIAQDEVTHAQLCHAVVVAAGSEDVIAHDAAQLRLPQIHQDLRKDCLAVLLSFYCLGETAAVPLFAAMRKSTRQALAVSAYERILQDEPRHAAFGWLTLAWADEVWPETRQWLHALFPAALHRMATQYHCQQEFTKPLTAQERDWGVLPRLQYATVFEGTVLGLYAKNLKYYDLDVAAVWADIATAAP